jgi:hypothetical protein
MALADVFNDPKYEPDDWDLDVAEIFTTLVLAALALEQQAEPHDVLQGHESACTLAGWLHMLSQLCTDLQWSMRWSSRQAVQPEVICIIIDSMVMWGSAWPKFNHDKIPNDLELTSRPTMILTAAFAHGWCSGLYFSLEPFGHGSVRALTVIITATQAVILLVTFSRLF